jgi:uncharacterized ferritin-like protein (DUF455 family)
MLGPKLIDEPQIVRKTVNRFSLVNKALHAKGLDAIDFEPVCRKGPPAE